MINVSSQQVIDTVRALVAERPDYVYTGDGEGYVPGESSCYYVHEQSDGTKVPGCLVGHALHALGVPLDVLEEYEGTSAHAAAEQTLSISDSATRTLSFLSVAQEWQDRGAPWGNALAVAEQGANSVSV